MPSFLPQLKNSYGIYPNHLMQKALQYKFILMKKYPELT